MSYPLANCFKHLHLFRKVFTQSNLKLFVVLVWARLVAAKATEEVKSKKKSNREVYTHTHTHTHTHIYIYIYFFFFLFFCVDTFVCIHFIRIANEFISNEVLMSDVVVFFMLLNLIQLYILYIVTKSPLKIRLQITDACYFIVNSI